MRRITAAHVRKTKADRLAGNSGSGCTVAAPNSRAGAEENRGGKNTAGDAQADIAQGPVIPAESHVGQTSAFEDPDCNRIGRCGGEKRAYRSGDQDAVGASNVKNSIRPAYARNAYKPIRSTRPSFSLGMVASMDSYRETLT